MLKTHQFFVETVKQKFSTSSLRYPPLYGLPRFLRATDRQRHFEFELFSLVAEVLTESYGPIRNCWRDIVNVKNGRVCALNRASSLASKSTSLNCKRVS